MINNEFSSNDEAIVRENVETVLKASETAVEKHVNEYYSMYGSAIPVRSVTSVYMDTGETENDVYIGFMTSLRRYYGPKNKEDGPIDLDQALENNGVSLYSGLIALNQHEHKIVSKDELEELIKSLDMLSLIKETGYTFDVSTITKSYDTSNPYASETFLKINNIKDKVGKTISGVEVSICLGPSSNFSDVAINDTFQNAKESAEEQMEAGDTVTGPIPIPRIPGLIAHISLSNEAEINADDPELEEKLSIGLKIANRCLEVVAEDLTNQPLFINPTKRTKNEMLSFKEGEGDMEWLNRLI